MYWDRTSFVIDPEGNLRKIYLKVQPDGHEQVLLNDIKEMQATWSEPPAVAGGPLVSAGK